MAFEIGHGKRGPKTQKNMPYKDPVGSNIILWDCWTINGMWHTPPKLNAEENILKNGWDWKKTFTFFVGFGKIIGWNVNASGVMGIGIDVIMG